MAVVADLVNLHPKVLLEAMSVATGLSVGVPAPVALLPVTVPGVRMVIAVVADMLRFYGSRVLVS